MKPGIRRQAAYGDGAIVAKVKSLSPVKLTSVKLGEVAAFYSGATPSKNRPEYWQSEIPWISAKDMKKKTY